MPSDRKLKVEVDGLAVFLLGLIVINLAVISNTLGEIRDVLKQQPVKVEQETRK